MSKRRVMESFEGLYALTSQYEDIVRKTNLENYKRLIENLTKTNSISIAVDDVVQRQAALLNSLNVSVYDRKMEMGAIIQQWETLATIANSFQTAEIIALKEGLINNNFYALQQFADSLDAPNIEAPNIALLKMTHAFKGVSLPQGLYTVVSSLHIAAAERLISTDNISFDVRTKKFYVEGSPEDTATVSETNIICSALSLLSDLDEADLISFINELEKYPTFASEHKIGRRIQEAIQKWDTYIGFDRDCFFHARSLPEGACPYTESELRQAPAGVTWHGRYNYVGQSHYYFSDEKRGAILEVGKHSKEPRIQIAKLKPIRPICMIDLSYDTKAKNKFLEYCRFVPNPEDYSNIKREYLLPCYVASCCERFGIEGIKYYGSKEYKNYVSWNDAYFDIVDFEIIDK